MKRGLSTLLLGAVLLGGCARTSPEATVNGEVISSTELNNAARLDRGLAMLQRLSLEHLILQDARKNGLTISDAELKPYRMQISARIKDPGLRKVADQELAARLLLRKLLLKDTSPARLQELYDMFKEELTIYECSALIARTKADADAAMAALKANYPFEDQSDKYSVVPALKRTRGKLPPMTIGRLSTLLGPAVAAAAAKLDDGGIAPIFPGGQGFLVLRVTHVRSSFGELRSKVEDIIVAGTAPLYLANLRESAKITAAAFSDPSLMPPSTILDTPIYLGFQEENPTEVDISATPVAKSTYGEKVGVDLGAAVPTAVVETPAPGSTTTGAEVGSDMGLKVPAVELPEPTVTPSGSATPAGSPTPGG